MLSPSCSEALFLSPSLNGIAANQLRLRFRRGTGSWPNCVGASHSVRTRFGRFVACWRINATICWPRAVPDGPLGVFQSRTNHEIDRAPGHRKRLEGGAVSLPGALGRRVRIFGRLPAAQRDDHENGHGCTSRQGTQPTRTSHGAILRERFLSLRTKRKKSAVILGVVVASSTGRLLRVLF
jgi:hypothetical protein